MVAGRIKYKNVYDEVSFITPDTTQATTSIQALSESNTTLASGSTTDSDITPRQTWSKRILDPDVQNYINFVMSDIGLSDIGMSDIELQQAKMSDIVNLTNSESMQKLKTVKSFKDLLEDPKPRSIWRFQRQKYSNALGCPRLVRSENSDSDGGPTNKVPVPSSRYTTILPRGTHEFIDDLSDDSTEDDLKFFEVTQWLNSHVKGYFSKIRKKCFDKNFILGDSKIHRGRYHSSSQF